MPLRQVIDWWTMAMIRGVKTVPWRYSSVRFRSSTIAGRLLPASPKLTPTPAWAAARGERQSCYFRFLAGTHEQRRSAMFSMACASAKGDNIAQSSDETECSERCGRGRLRSPLLGIPLRPVNAKPNTSSSMSLGWTRSASATSSLLTHFAFGERREHLLQHLRNLTGSAIRLFFAKSTRRDLDIELAIVPFRQKIEFMEAVGHRRE